MINNYLNYNCWKCLLNINYKTIELTFNKFTQHFNHNITDINDFIKMTNDIKLRASHVNDEYEYLDLIQYIIRTYNAKYGGLK